MATKIQGVAPLSEQTSLKRAWKDTPRSTAEQIEIALRRGNSEKQQRLDDIETNCKFVMTNSTNTDLKLFAGVILRIALTARTGE